MQAGARHQPCPSVGARPTFVDSDNNTTRTTTPRLRPNLFKSTPIVTSKEWDLLQTLHVHTLIQMQVVKN